MNSAKIANDEKNNLKIKGVTTMSREVLSFDDCHIIFRNFSGEPSQYNRKGDRNFSLVIENPDVAAKLIDDGWNVKIRPPRDDQESTFYYLPVKVKFGDYPPNIYLVTGRKRILLTEETVGCIDGMSFTRVDLDISPFYWEVNGKSGITAYLTAMKVIQNIDRFAAEEFSEPQ